LIIIIINIYEKSIKLMKKEFKLIPKVYCPIVRVSKM